MIESYLQLIYLRVLDKGFYKPALARREGENLFTIVRTAERDRKEGVLEYHEGQRVICTNKPMGGVVVKNSKRLAWIAIANADATSPEAH